MVQIEGKIFDFLAFWIARKWLKREANSSWKNIKMKLTLLKKAQKLLNFTDFFFVSAKCTAILSSNWKNNTLLTVSTDLKLVYL